MGKKPKLMWWCPIWKDPLNWSRWIGNNKIHLSIAIVFQVVIVSLYLMLLLLLNSPSFPDSIRFYYIYLSWTFLFIIGVEIPALLMYAIYRLLKTIDEQQLQIEQIEDTSNSTN